MSDQEPVKVLEGPAPPARITPFRAGHTNAEVKSPMAKQGMARPEWTHAKPRNDVSPVPEIKGKAKHGGKRAPAIVPGTGGARQKVRRHEKENPPS